MGCDMVVALGPATVKGCTIFGHNAHHPLDASPRLFHLPGREFAAGEKVRLQHLVLPQVRQTWTILGSQPPGCWGLEHGMNEHQVAAGCATWLSKLAITGPALTGPDLVRLVLERCRSARQGLDLLTDLVTRHGQGSGNGRP